MADLGEWFDGSVMADAAAVLLHGALDCRPADQQLATDISALSSRLADMSTARSAGRMSGCDVDDELDAVFDALAELSLRAERLVHPDQHRVTAGLDRAEGILVRG